jgi:hypothetical protein
MGQAGEVTVGAAFVRPGRLARRKRLLRVKKRRRLQGDALRVRKNEGRGSQTRLARSRAFTDPHVST